MMMRRLTAKRDEGGFAMILVIATMGIVLAIVVLASVIAIRSQRSSTQHVEFEQALAVAEYGLNQGLARVDESYTTSGGDYVTPTPTATSSDCAQAVVSWSSASPTQGISAGTDERGWARDWLTYLATKTGCLRHSTAPSADYVMMRPSGRQTVYSMSWVPSYGASGAKSRLLKAEYIFSPYKPQDAILTQDALTIDSSTKVTTASSGTASQAAVHSNDVITVGGGNPTVTGVVSSTNDSGGAQSNNFQSNTGGKVTTSAAEEIPTISARQVYMRNVAEYISGSDESTAPWYDLCSDGKVRKGSTSGPCTGDVLYDASGGATVLNAWTFHSATDNSCLGTGAPCWVASKAPNDGLYYADGSDVIGGTGNGGMNYGTIIAAASNQGDCSTQTGGNISWAKTNISTPALTGLFMLADADLATGANFYAGSDNGSGQVVSGMFVAGDQVNLQTSSAGAYGSVVAAGQCTQNPNSKLVTTNEVKNPDVYYDPNGSAPFSSVIDTTLWLEYASGQ